MLAIKPRLKKGHKNMKTAFSFISRAGVALSLLGLVTACQSTAVAPSAASQKEKLLVQSGFKSKTVTTAKQQQEVSALPAGEVSTVGYGGQLYYVYPTATKDRILVGTQTEYNAYKQALVAYGLTTSPSFVRETHGPHPVLIQHFNGFGPLGD
jgi:capsule polysaccharide export protein KpsC/LpsZ